MKQKIGVIGSGSMGSGIAQIAATEGHVVYLYDNNLEALNKAMEKVKSIVNRLVEKKRIDSNNAQVILENIIPVNSLADMVNCQLVIEAIVENIEIKQQLFRQIEEIVDDKAVLASNTSSLSIASIASACKNPERVLGIHFFNPAPLMPLVEIIPGVMTDDVVVQETRSLIDSWKKVTVLAKDTPGFIVNRLARPFYGEALRIYEEGMADFATIDWAMKSIGNFRMGPFELMDYIGNDINYTVTETVFESFFYDPRYKPSFTQKRMMEAGLLGRKSGRGYYDYAENANLAQPKEDVELGNAIVERIVVMLINEAADALHLNIASKEDLDLAMTKGVNYPKGLLQWADDIGIEHCYNQLKSLQEDYGEDRYRPSILLKRMSQNNETFY